MPTHIEYSMANYPLYRQGNPQLRIFLPNFWMKLIRSEEPLPPYQVLFQTSIQMTQYDIKNYLEKIYKIPVVEVKTTIKMGEIKKCFGRQHLIKDDDYKEALVTMPTDFKFEYPDFTGDKSAKEEMKSYKNFKEQHKVSKSNEKIDKSGVPTWFHY
ncbi:mitochondrial 50S ribosomal protein L23, putative [Pediculus humanus corporis]|uniref:Large ribosomal subunit protein uL23m n=1 Tax=Pediculus humanus subsp. corporis TaxID=121224 RepID=E0VPS9_PEDHC|nr:mitochondrial 50S ribosomal protein L23, putative [Pediculus humanus corporis]EEB15385.1 mitochondrial 50S ribosomal protein L23, putative [Pediculus humanus corporis]